MAALLVAAFSVPCGAGESAREHYAKRGITVTGSNSWKPYSYIANDGSPTGFYIDFWSKWSEKTGIPVSFRLTTWKESIELVKNGECDLHSGLYYTEERSGFFGFSKPVFYGKAVVVVGKDVSCGADYTTLAWGGVSGSTELEHAATISGGNVTSFKSSTLMFKALDVGSIQAAVDDWSTVLMLGKDLGLSDGLKICETVYQRDILGAVRKENEALLGIIDEGILQITEPERRVVVSRWFVEEHEGRNWWHIFMLGALGLGAAILGAFAYKRWHRPSA